MMIATQRSDETAKRAWTTDPLAAKEEADSSLMKKPRVEEEGEQSKSPITFFSSGKIVRRFKYEPEPEPEWDVDSYDGREYESDSEVRKFFSDDDEYNEYRLYKRELFESKGFEPDPDNGIYCFGGLDEPATKNMTNRDFLTDLASLCVKKLNEDKGKTVELERVVRATVSGGGRWKIYMTVMAREYQNGPLVEYQAKVMRYAGNYRPPFPILCRPSPKSGI